MDALVIQATARDKRDPDVTVVRVYSLQGWADTSSP